VVLPEILAWGRLGGVADATHEALMAADSLLSIEASTPQGDSPSLVKCLAKHLRTPRLPEVSIVSGLIYKAYDRP
jgi:hypothetical protein